MLTTETERRKEKLHFLSSSKEAATLQRSRAEAPEPGIGILERKAHHLSKELFLCFFSVAYSKPIFLVVAPESVMGPPNWIHS